MRLVNVPSSSRVHPSIQNALSSRARSLSTDDRLRLVVLDRRLRQRPAKRVANLVQVLAERETARAVEVRQGR